MAETRDALIVNRGNTKRRITNLIKKVEPLVTKEEKLPFDAVCAKQYLDELRELETPTPLLWLESTNQELIEKDFGELDAHDDRIREHVSKLLDFLSTLNSRVSEPKENTKVKRLLEARWTRISAAVNTLVGKISKAKENLQEAEIDDLTDARNQLFESEKALDSLTSEIDSISGSVESPGGGNWNDAIAAVFVLIQTTQGTLSKLIALSRRDQSRRIIEREIQREHKHIKELQYQNDRHREELDKPFHEFKINSGSSETKTIKLPTLNIPTFDG